MNYSKLSISTLATALAAASFAQTFVYPNNPNGDLYSNPTAVNQGQAVGTSGWYYNNVRNGGQVGINTTYARNGNGSAFMQTADGSQKADMEFLATAVNIAGNFYASTSLGTLGSLTSLSYDWYRDSVSTTAVHFAPSIRLYVDKDGDLNTILDRGYLIYERIYNGGPVAPVDTWTHETITGGSFLWANVEGQGATGQLTLNDYMTGNNGFGYSASSKIMGLSSGLGSGWTGLYRGAIDNVEYGINGNSTTFNFEAQPVPDPFTTGLGLAGAVLMVRRRLRK